MKFIASLAAAVVVLLARGVLGPPRDPAEPVRAAIVRVVVKHPWLSAAAVVAVVATGAAAVVVSGVMPIKASSGHWPVTAALLDFAKTRSVATYSRGLEAPALDDEALIVRGAGHYDIGCAACHGRPGAAVPPVMAGMTPAPPALTADRLRRYDASELFVIVKHGIKFTGMPAWPAQQRDDEVWAIVAFLRRMPRLGPGDFRRLADGRDDAARFTAAGDAPPAVRDVCARCHGEDGTGRVPGAFPSLAGQRAEYLYQSLRAFANRSRISGTMTEVASKLGDGQMRAVAAYYEALPPRRGDVSVDAAAAARGAALVSRGAAERDIPACAECHGPSDTPKNPQYPRLAGQDVGYLTSQLTLLQRRQRGGSPNVALMHVFVDRLSVAQVRDAASYYGSLAPRP